MKDPTKGNHFHQSDQSFDRFGKTTQRFTDQPEAVGIIISSEAVRNLRNLTQAN